MPQNNIIAKRSNGRYSCSISFIIVMVAVRLDGQHPLRHGYRFQSDPQYTIFGCIISRDNFITSFIIILEIFTPIKASCRSGILSLSSWKRHYYSSASTYRKLGGRMEQKKINVIFLLKFLQQVSMEFHYDGNSAVPKVTGSL